MRKPCKSIPSGKVQSVIDSYRLGATTVDLAQEYDVTSSTVSYLLKKHGVQIRSRSEINHARAPVDLLELRRLVDEAKLSLHVIADQLGVSLPTVERHLRRLGLKSKKGRGSPMEKNYFWNGGRSEDVDGYVLVKAHEHPFADNRGYVREHRLVMEQVLGRYLHPQEVVHHVDGNPRNNEPSNLEVFRTNAEHLRHELTGKTPNYSPDGLRRMRENALRLNHQRYAASRKA